MKFRFLITILVVHFSLLNVNSQVSQDWVSRYHFISEDQATAIALDNEGKVYVTGNSEALTPSGARTDYATIKYNSAGVQLWVQRYNGPGNDFDVTSGIVVDDSGNVYITGRSNRIPFPGQANYDVVTIKYNTNGVQQWLRRYDSGGNDDADAGIVLDKQGNIYVGGRGSVLGYLVIKYSSNGDSLWIRTYDSGNHGADAMAADSFGNVCLTGAYGTTSNDWGTVKWNSEGVFQWAKIFNGPGNGADYPQDIAADNSGNVYVTGVVWGNNNGDFATVKYNTLGVQQWAVFYNGGYDDGAWSIITDDSENVYVTGQSSSGGSNLDYLTVKYNGGGFQQWTARFNGPANSYDLPCCIKLDTQGNVYVAGYATVSANNTDYCTIKYNNAGVQQWVIYYNGTGNSNDRATALAIGSAGNLYVTGWSRRPGNQDYATIKYSQPLGIKQISNEIPKEYKLEQNYPNPFNPATHFEFRIPARSAGGADYGFVSLKIFDVSGKEIQTLVNEQLKPGIYEVDFDGSMYSSGIYYYTLSVLQTGSSTGDFKETKKMVLIK